MDGSELQRVQVVSKYHVKMITFIPVKDMGGCMDESE
jgi:hypothetical protein